MKGSQTLAWSLILMGMIVTYSGFTDKPILSVLGIGNALGKSAYPVGPTTPQSVYAASVIHSSETTPQSVYAASK